MFHLISHTVGRSTGSNLASIRGPNRLWRAVILDGKPTQMVSMCNCFSSPENLEFSIVKRSRIGSAELFLWRKDMYKTSTFLGAGQQML